jgi:hypothetical protein
MKFLVPKNERNVLIGSENNGLAMFDTVHF